MVVERARELLKEDAASLTDEQVQNLIDVFTNLADVAIDQFQEKVANNDRKPLR